MPIVIPDFNTTAVINGNTLIAQADEQLNILMDDVKEYVETTYDGIATSITTATAADAASALAYKNAAATSATNAATSATTATTKATAAATSETNALASKNAAATSATSAASSATSASSSATSAASSATSATTSATTATTKASEASTSAANALASANAAAASYDSFDDRYLGVKASDPTVDNDGGALLVGALYFNSTIEAMKVRTSTGWSVVTLLDVYTKSEVQSSLPSVGFSTAGNVAPNLGQLTWNSDENTVNLGTLNGSSIQLGQENIRTVRNSTASIITNGTPVMFDGTIGASGRIKVKPFTGGFNEAHLLYGVATQDIAAGADGIITIDGKVRGVNTSGSLYGETWADGDILYAKPNGTGLTKVVPSSTELKIIVCAVISAHATNGVLEIRIHPLNENANAATATKLQTTRSISLTGDVTGTVNFDGSANASITTTIAANSVALGTDTTGNYVAGLTQGTGITVSGTAGEGWSPTVAITNVGTAGTYTKVTTNAQGQVTSGTSLSASDIPSLDASKITTGIIDAARLPAFVDDVLEFANQASFPATGESGKIYVALDTNKTYRWSGSVYVYITSGAVDSVNGQTGVVNITTITGNAGTATALQTARTVQTNLGSTASASFDGSANITPGVTGTLPVGNGGTGATTLTGIVKGNGTGAMTAATAGTDYVIPSGSISGNAGTATKLQTSRNIALAGAIVGSVNFDGSADVSISTTLGAQSFIQSSGLSTSWGATSGTSTGALNVIMGTSSSATWLLSGTSGGVFRSGIQSLDSNGTLRLYSNSNYIEINGNQITGNISTASALATGRTIGMTGDVTWTSAAFNGLANVTGTATLANSGVTAGTYKSVTVDAKGRVTAGTNPTTLSGYGISDTYTKTEVDSLIGDINSALDTINGQVI